MEYCLIYFLILFRLYYFSKKELCEQMRILEANMKKPAEVVPEVETAARALMKNLGAVITAITKVGGNWNKVMNNIKDWAEAVSILDHITSCRRDP